MGLWGHGLRRRSQLGPAAAGERAGSEWLLLRRFQCQRCNAIMTAAPRGLLPRLRYGAVAVALALGLWSAEQQPGWRVRQQVSPLGSTGNEPLHGWRSLSRWARLCDEWLGRTGPPCGGRAAALELTRQLAARAPIPTGRLWLDACAGAAHAMPIGAGRVVLPSPPSGSVAL